MLVGHEQSQLESSNMEICWQKKLTTETPHFRLLYRVRHFLYLCGRQHGAGVVAVYGRVVAERLVLGLHPREHGGGRGGAVRRLVVDVIGLQKDDETHSVTF